MTVLWLVLAFLVVTGATGILQGVGLMLVGLWAMIFGAGRGPNDDVR